MNSDDDWAVISSCSEIEEERETPPLEEDTLNDSIATSIQKSEDKLRDSSIDYTIFKIPEIQSDTSSLHNSVEVTNKLELPPARKQINEEGTKLQSPPSTRIPLGSTNSDLKSDVSIGLVIIGDKIDYFENLAKFNQTIKQRSSDFNYDREKREQLHSYISDQHEQLKEQESNEELESETISKPVCEDYPFDASEDSEVTPSTSSSPPSRDIGVTYVKKKRLVISCLQRLEQVLDRNSDYLYYYMVAFAVGVFACGYYLRLFVSPTAPQKTGTFDSLSQFWDTLVYEKQDVPGGIFLFTRTQTKVNRISRMGRMLELKAKDYLSSLLSKAPVLQETVARKLSEIRYISQISMNRLDVFGKQVWDIGHVYGAQAILKLSKFQTSSYIAMDGCLCSLGGYLKMGMKNSNKVAMKTWDNLHKFSILASDKLGEFRKNSSYNLDRYVMLGRNNLNEYRNKSIPEFIQKIHLVFPKLNIMKETTKSNASRLASAGVENTRNLVNAGLGYAAIGAELIASSLHEYFAGILGS